MTQTDSPRLPAPSAPSSATGASASAAEGPAEDNFGFVPPEYDPADYRWVPVRRVPRSDGWTEEKQRRFIEILADTGLVSRAARAVGMSREAAYRLRRAPHAGAFARAWDLARARAGALVEDIAFERALEGVETEVYDSRGALTGSKTIYNDRLLCFLLRHLKPETYGTVTQMREGEPPPRPARLVSSPRPAAEAGAAGPAALPDAALPDAALPDAPPLEAIPGTPPDTIPGPLPDTLDEALRAMEPALPAPAGELLDPETLADECQLAEAADGRLPNFLAEQRRAKSAEQERDDYLAELRERGDALNAAQDAGEPLDMDAEDFAAYCLSIDPTQAEEIPRKWKKRRKGLKRR